MRIAALEAFEIDDKVIDLWAQSGIKSLLPIQEKAVRDHGALTGNNLLLFSPTSSGKTFVGEMAAVKMARKERKVLYLVPQKALAEEKYREFRKKYEDLEIEVVVSTRDRKTYDHRIRRGHFHIAVVVYEKMQNLLVATPSLLEKIGLVVIDELQMIGDPERGANLELLLTKIKLATNPPQLIGLSAVLGNSRHLADWLGAEFCEETKRPVELRKGTVLRGAFKYLEHNSGAEGEEQLAKVARKAKDRQVLRALVSSFYSAGEQTLVFCKTKLECIQTALTMAKGIKGKPAQGALADIRELEESRGKEILTELLSSGVAYHNSDLDWDQRDVIERHFRSGEIKVLCATSTLAMGINMPARNVIIDPERWDRDQYGNWMTRPILQAEFENMSGRAGRLGFGEAFGRAIIVVSGQFREMSFQDIFIRGDLEDIEPTLDRGDLADHALNLVASTICRTTDEVRDTLLSSFTGQYRWKTGIVRNRFHSDLRDAIRRCIDGGVLRIGTDDTLEVTGLGQVAASKAIPVKTAIHLADFARRHVEHAHDVSVFEILCSLICNEEGDSNYINLSTEEYNSGRYLQILKEAVANLHRGAKGRLGKVFSLHYLEYERTQRVKKTLLLHEWVQDVPTTDIEDRYHTYTGTIINLAREFSWLAEALADIAKLCAWQEEEVKRIRTLAGQLVHGVPEEGVDLSEIRVRGLGRARIVKLYSEGFFTIEDILRAEQEQVAKLVTVPVADRLFEECRRLLAYRAYESKERAKECEVRESTAPTLHLDGTVRNRRHLAYLNGEEVWLRPRSFEIALKLAIAAKENPPGWISGANLAASAEYHQSISRLKADLITTSGDTELIDNNGQKQYRLIIPGDHISISMKEV